MKKLIVPSNMALQWELFSGFGKKELVRTGIVCLAGSALLYAGVLIQLFNTLIAIGLFLVLLTISIQLFARTVFNTSMFDQICMTLRQGEKGQTKFYYHREEVQLFVCEEDDGE